MLEQMRVLMVSRGSPLGVPAYLVTRMIKELLDDLPWT